MAMAIARTLRPSARIASARSISARPMREGRPHLPPSPSILSAVASRSTFAAHANDGDDHLGVPRRRRLTCGAGQL